MNGSLRINLFYEFILYHLLHLLLPSAREPEVLSVMATVVNKLKSYITPQVEGSSIETLLNTGQLILNYRFQIPTIFDAVFECTLDMINKDFEEHPEHRTNFFTLLQVLHLCSSRTLCSFVAPGLLVPYVAYLLWALQLYFPLLQQNLVPLASLNSLMNRPGVAGAVLQTALSLIN